MQVWMDFQPLDYGLCATYCTCSNKAQQLSSDNEIHPGNIKCLLQDASLTTNTVFLTVGKHELQSIKPT